MLSGDAAAATSGCPPFRGLNPQRGLVPPDVPVAPDGEAAATAHPAVGPFAVGTLGSVRATKKNPVDELDGVRI